MKEPGSGSHDGDGSGGNGDRLARVAYIEAMLLQLRRIAEAERCDMLAYLIDMAGIEAGDILRGRRPPLARRGAAREGKL